MSVSLDMEAQRLKNLQQKQKLLEALNLDVSRNPNPGKSKRVKDDPDLPNPNPNPAKRQRRRDPSTHSTFQARPSRTSARIAARVSYTEERDGHKSESLTLTNAKPKPSRPKSEPNRQRPASLLSRPSLPSSSSSGIPPTPTPQTKYTNLLDLSALLDQYNDWTPIAPEPNVLADGTYHFPSHPTFTPNISPLSILLEGAFGGQYFSPWHSRTLGLVLQDDYLKTLPATWLSQLQPASKYLTSPAYDARLNKYGVACGQSLTQWEEAGWMNFNHDPGGWFEWYIRFWLGRRCDDGEDERQVGRWLRCVGPRGRWKHLLLKKYVELGVRSIFDDDDHDDQEVSPVMHQTCHHWAYQVRQEDLDEAWRKRGGMP